MSSTSPQAAANANRRHAGDRCEHEMFNQELSRERAALAPRGGADRQTPFHGLRSGTQEARDVVQASSKMAIAANPGRGRFRPRASELLGAGTISTREPELLSGVQLLEIDRHRVHLLLEMRGGCAVSEPSQHAQIRLGAMLSARLR